MSDSPEAIAARLSAAQKRAIYPGPGNPEYARGRLDTMMNLMRRGIVWAVYHSSDGMRGAQLTAIGQAVRAVLEAQKP